MNKVDIIKDIQEYLNSFTEEAIKDIIEISEEESEETDVTVEEYLKFVNG